MAKVCMSLASHNSYEWLKNVSLPSILAQTYKDWHLYVVNDGEKGAQETEDLIKQINDPRITFQVVDRILPEPPFEIGTGYWNVAGFNAVNKGLELIQQNQPECRYIAHIDADDYWAPVHLKECIKFLDYNSKYDLVYTNTLQFLENQPSYIYQKDYSRADLMQANFIPHSSIVYRKNCKHEYYYSGDTSEPSDYAHLKSFSGDFKRINLNSVLYFQRCTVDYAMDMVKKYGYTN